MNSRLTLIPWLAQCDRRHPGTKPPPQPRYDEATLNGIVVVPRPGVCDACPAREPYAFFKLPVELHLHILQLAFGELGACKGEQAEDDGPLKPGGSAQQNRLVSFRAIAPISRVHLRLARRVFLDTIEFHRPENVTILAYGTFGTLTKLGSLVRRVYMPKINDSNGMMEHVMAKAIDCFWNAEAIFRAPTKYVFDGRMSAMQARPVKFSLSRLVRSITFSRSMDLDTLGTVLDQLPLLETIVVELKYIGRPNRPPAQTDLRVIRMTLLEYIGSYGYTVLPIHLGLKSGSLRILYLTLR